MNTVPMAASGQPAPITLVEIATRKYVSAGTSSAPAGFTPPAPPRATNPGESMAWAFAGAASPPTDFVIGSNVYNDFNGNSGAASGTLVSGSLSLHNGNVFVNTVQIEWSDFQMPVEVPPGSVITAVYPIAVVSAVTPAPNTSLTYTGGSLAPSVGTQVGLNIGSIFGKTITALLQNTLAGSTLDANLTISTVVMAVYYEAAALPEVAAGGGAEEALARGIFFWSERDAKWPSILTGQVEHFLDWLDQPTEIKLYASVQTDTAHLSVQNISGNTVERDAAKIFAKNGLVGALAVIRIWRGDGEKALRTFIGNVKNVELTDPGMVIDIDGFGNWSSIDGVPYDIDTSCGLNFGSTECGSTSPTPCDQTYGTCTSINRFRGVLAQWITEVPNVQLAQPVPVNTRNNKRPF